MCMIILISRLNSLRNAFKVFWITTNNSMYFHVYKCYTGIIQNSEFFRVFSRYASLIFLRADQTSCNALSFLVCKRIWSPSSHPFDIRSAKWLPERWHKLHSEIDNFAYYRLATRKEKFISSQMGYGKTSCIQINHNKSSGMICRILYCTHLKFEGFPMHLRMHQDHNLIMTVHIIAITSLEDYSFTTFLNFVAQGFDIAGAKV